FRVVDLFIPADGELYLREKQFIEQSGKEIVYNCPLMIGEGLNPHSPAPGVRKHTIGEAKKYAERALGIGARKMVVASGPNPGSESDKQEQTVYFTEYLVELCQYVAPNMDILIEPFDSSIGKNLLIGSSAETAKIVRQLQQRGCKNIGILVDMGHLPLMGESFADALAVCAPYAKHIHLGNCVRSNPQNPYYGDMHPPWGCADGEHDIPHIVDFLRCLFLSGYLGSGGAELPTVTMEMRQYDGLTAAMSIDLFLAKFRQAWGLLGRENGSLMRAEGVGNP
ncbi:MAG: xylose isomerase, partial [Paenibacillaceae bacterium]|nr:xylose isomerase [Paenibacillaceae bacterium]